MVDKLGWKKTRLSLIETGRIRLDQEEAGLLADTYRSRRSTDLPVRTHSRCRAQPSAAQSSTESRPMRSNGTRSGVRGRIVTPGVCLA
ncbi:hypothetical protein [Kribbella orskensis]|uniref:hypothetical protein n=1 Tax=Kribbella TaxID=182639 RepID=UPI0034E1DB41